MPDVFIAKEEKIETPLPRKTNHAHKHMGVLKAFAEYPEGVSFANQKTHEKVVLFLRRHLITNFLWLAVFIILLTIPLISFFIFNSTLNPLPFVSDRFIFVLVLLYYLIIFAYAFLNFISWFYNITIITNLGVVDIDYSDLLYHDVAFTNFNLVEDVNYTKAGFFRSFFNYGDVFVQTAGGRENIEGLAVPNPARSAHIISDSIGKGDGSG